MSNINVPRSVELDSSVTELDGVADARADLLATIGIETVEDLHETERDELLELDGIGANIASAIGKQASEVWLRDGRMTPHERSSSNSSFLDHGHPDTNELDVGLLCSQTWNNGRASRNLQARVREAISDVSEEFNGRIRTARFIGGAADAPSNAPHKVFKWAIEDLNEDLPDRAEIWPLIDRIPWDALPEVNKYRPLEAHEEVRVTETDDETGEALEHIWIKAPKAATERIIDSVDVVIFMDEHDFVERDVRYAKSQRTAVYFAQEVPGGSEPDADQTTTAEVRTTHKQSDDPAFDPSPLDTDRGRENPYSEQQATLEEEDRYADWTKFDRQQKQG